MLNVPKPMTPETCQHIWMLEKTESYYSHFTDHMVHVGFQRYFYCQRDPHHTITIPTDEEMLQRDKDLFDLRYEFSKEYLEDLKIANSFQRSLSALPTS